LQEALSSAPHPETASPSLAQVIQAVSPSAEVLETLSVLSQSKPEPPREEMKHQLYELGN
jgi:hypothetical protein